MHIWSRQFLLTWFHKQLVWGAYYKAQKCFVCNCLQSDANTLLIEYWRNFFVQVTFQARKIFLRPAWVLIDILRIQWHTGVCWSSVETSKAYCWWFKLNDMPCSKWCKQYCIRMIAEVNRPAGSNCAFWNLLLPLWTVMPANEFISMWRVIYVTFDLQLLQCDVLCTVSPCQSHVSDTSEHNEIEWLFMWVRKIK